MSRTIWERYFKDEYDAAELDYQRRLARPLWITYVEADLVAGYAMQWPLHCPHCNRSLLLEPVAQEDMEDAVVLLVAEERLSSAPCPACHKDVATKRATKQTIEQWAGWQFLKIWVAVQQGETVQVQAWNT